MSQPIEHSTSVPSTETPPPTTPQFVVVQKLGNGMAVTALVLGIVGVFLGLIPILALPALFCGVLALIFGGVGLGRAVRNPIRSGKGMAIAGLVLGVVAVGLSIVGFVIVSNAFST